MIDRRKIYRALFVALMLTTANVPGHASTVNAFAGVYASVRAQSGTTQDGDGRYDVKFALIPAGNELQGVMSIQGEKSPLRASINGMTLNGVFGTAENPYGFRMSLSSSDSFKVIFVGDDSGAWTFSRTPAPTFTGEFSGDFGAITLTELSGTSLSGTIKTASSQESVEALGDLQGLTANLMGGAMEATIFFDMQEGRYFVSMSGFLGPAKHRTMEDMQARIRAERAKDNSAWNLARTQGSKQAYDAYLRQWPNGAHKDEISQLPQIIWERRFDFNGQGDRAVSIVAVDDGGFMILATGLIDTGFYAIYKKHLWLIKIDRHGDKQWARDFGAKSGEAQDLVKSADGAYLIVGEVMKDYKHTPHLIKVNSHGKVLWDKFFPMKGRDLTEHGVAASADGGYLLASAYFSGQNMATRFQKLDANGRVLHENAYVGSLTAATAFGDDQFLACGENGAKRGGGILQLDNNAEASRAMGVGVKRPLDILSSRSGDVYISGGGGSDKLDAQLNKKWHLGRNALFGFVAEDVKGNILIGNALFSPEMGKIWDVSLGTHLPGGGVVTRDAAATPDGGFIVVGYNELSSSDAVHKESDVVILKISPPNQLE